MSYFFLLVKCLRQMTIGYGSLSVLILVLGDTDSIPGEAGMTSNQGLKDCLSSFRHSVQNDHPMNSLKVLEHFWL